MFKVAICDDEPLICSQIENIILDYADENSEKIETQVFYRGEELCKFLDCGESFDLFFLDIELKMINGIEIGKKIREEMDNQTVQIVYTSEKEDYYRELFEVRPMHVLNKPLRSDDIIRDVRLALKLTHKLGGIFIYRKGHETFRRSVKNILYFESNNREVKNSNDGGRRVFLWKA